MLLDISGIKKEKKNQAVGWIEDGVRFSGASANQSQGKKHKAAPYSSN